MKFFVTLVLSVLFIYSLTGCEKPGSLNKFKLYSFGTEIEIVYFAPKGKHALIDQSLKARFDQLHYDWHAWEQGGILSKINTALSQGEFIEVDQRVLEVIIKARSLSALSKQYFNPVIGNLIAAWGFQSNIIEDRAPPFNAIERYLKNPAKIEQLHIKGNRLSSTNPQLKIDLGGIAKGYAADLISNILRTNNVDNAIINLGGDVKVLGQYQNRAWKIGITNPIKPEEAAITVGLCPNQAIFSSGTYERFFEWEGKNYHHILNPKSGFPEYTWVSASVIHDDAVVADVAATALIAAGDRWEEVIDSMDLKYVYLIDYDGNVRTTSDWNNRRCFD